MLTAQSAEPGRYGITHRGSFWTNDSAHVPEIAPDDRTRLRPCGGCLQQGFNSVALIPIRAQDEVVGLLQKQAEEQRALFRSALDNSSDQIFLIDRDEMRFIDVNQTACRDLGYSYDELLEMGPHEIKPEYSRDEVEAELDRVFSDEAARGSLTTAHRARHGKRIPVEVMLRALPNPERRLIVAVARDVTERERAADELRESYRQVQNSMEHAAEMARKADAANEAKSRFLATMSHELRTPMNGIVGMGHLLQQTELNRQQHDYLQHINSSAGTLLALINDILDYSRFEADKMPLEPRPFSLEDVLDRISKTTRLRAEEKEIELLFSVAPETPQRVVGDALRLEQALLNLVTNAVKFTERGEVIVRVHPQEAHEPEESPEPSSTGVAGETEDRAGEVLLAFEVEDTGVGIEPDKIADLFNPFTQAEGGYTRRHGGSGLGLAITRQIARSMNGEVECRSTPGEGSCFTLTARFAPDEHGERAPLHIGELKGTRALMVEDNLAAREVLIENLAHTEMELVLAGSGEEALEEYRRALQAGRGFDFLILDWKLPGMSGIDTKKAVYAETPPNTSPPKSIIITAYGKEEAIRDGAAADLATVLEKPVMQSQLIDTLITVAGDARRDAAATAAGNVDEPHEKTADLPAWKSEASAALRGARVLVVDDVAANRMVARELMQSVGMMVQEAEHGAEAIEILTSTETAGSEVDVVLMDLQMPVLDGLTATRKLRHAPQLETLPIVALTAHAMPEERARCLEAGMNDLVTKPIDPQELFSVLARCVPDAQSRGEVHPDTYPAAGELPARLPGLDVETALNLLGNNHAVYLQLLSDFHDEIDSGLRELERLIQERHYPDAEALAHRIKGQAGNLRMSELHHAASELENCLHTERFQEAGTRLRELGEQVTVVRSSIARLTRAND